VLTFFVLGLSMLIMPSLTATSINGDREHGVLATL
jgi:ABC-2 type transport system permease protein